jgi:TRAP-type uncharacterized transport system substrate-binding protein
MQFTSPQWLRITLVAAAIFLTSGISFAAYRYANKPVTLTVAAGSIDGDAPRLMSAIATRLASSSAHLRLKIVAKDSAIDAHKAFLAGETDLAVLRADLGDMSSARALLRIANGVVLIIVPAGSSFDSLDELKGKTIGLVGGEVNHRVVDTLKSNGGVDIQFKDLTADGAAAAINAKQVQALLVVIPLSEKYLSMARGLTQSGSKAKVKAKLVAIDSAEAIAIVAPYYESYELPKGALRGVPPLPDEDLTTLRVPYYLVARRTLDKDLATELTKTVMEARRDLVNEFPILSQVSAPSTDSDAFIPIHPGAKIYFDGEEKSFFDKHGDKLFYGSMALGSLTSLLAAAWRFMGFGSASSVKSPLGPFPSLAERIRAARTEADLESVEEEIDNLIKAELEKYASGGSDPADAATLSLTTHRLEHLIGQRRQRLAAG